MTWNIEGWGRNCYNLRYFTNSYLPDLIFLSEPQCFQCDIMAQFDLFSGSFSYHLNSSLPWPAPRLKKGFWWDNGNVAHQTGPICEGPPNLITIFSSNPSFNTWSRSYCSYRHLFAYKWQRVKVHYSSCSPWDNGDYDQWIIFLSNLH